LGEVVVDFFGDQVAVVTYGGILDVVALLQGVAAGPRGPEDAVLASVVGASDLAGGHCG